MLSRFRGLFSIRFSGNVLRNSMKIISVTLLKRNLERKVKQGYLLLKKLLFKLEKGPYWTSEQIYPENAESEMEMVPLQKCLFVKVCGCVCVCAQKVYTMSIVQCLIEVI